MCEDQFKDVLRDQVQDSDLKKLICPEKNKFDELVKLKGFYRNKEKRMSL
jgi:endonuclease III-like uncharacterized protein